nr:molybdate transporter 1 [Tanacetum cinerariifolium]
MESNNHQSSQQTSTSLPQKLKENLVFRSKWAELNGAMGDLETYIPIVLALTLASHLNLGTTLIFTGVYNIVTGAIYGVPMLVQPMKSIAVVAIFDPDFGIPEVVAASICTGVILFSLGVTGLMRLSYRLIPLPVVRGIQLAQDLFPEKSVTPTSVSVTVGLMNVIGCWFGAMPCCHGAGGLAGQYKFGRRSGACVALLGAAKLVLGLLLGSSIVKILIAFPVAVLGVLLLFAGIELAMCARDMKSKEESFVVLICTAVSLVGSSAALGFATLISSTSPGPSNVIARRVVDDLLEFSDETSVLNALSFFNTQQIVEGRRFINLMHDEVQTCKTLIGQLNALITQLEAMEDQGKVFDSLMSFMEDRRNDNDKLLGLNDLIAQALKEIQAKEAHVDAANNSGYVYGLLGLVFKVLLSSVVVLLLYDFDEMDMIFVFRKSLHNLHRLIVLHHPYERQQTGIQAGVQHFAC